MDLGILPGEIHALLGPNGAGKTTLIRVLAGLVDPDAGSVEVSGSVGLVPSGDRTFYLRISGLENLVFFGRLHGLRLRAARARALEALNDVGLSEAARLAVGKYSHGMQKRLSVARALLVDPSVLLVDEATHDLDPEGARQIRALIGELAGRGTAILWTTQRVEEIRDFAHVVSFINRGEVRFTGSVSELIARAPAQRYVVRIRNGHPDIPPRAEVLQQALGSVASVVAGPRGQDDFVLDTGSGAALGPAVAALARGGYELMACRPERAEIEEAFLALTDEAPS
ncbi:MAG TPA: ABC transporter ATP-binding protein [Solirubrobacteraceae bacterium]|nr:ABC transporter ATP-binding protein [Solirubrobacteraceae bacterium]